MRWIASWWVGCLAAMACWPCRGDEWGRPTPEHESRNGQYVLMVGRPKAKELSLYRRTADGEQVVWTRGSVDEGWPPYQAYVADDGQHVVLRDRHGELGYGKVLVFLGPRGEVLRSRELKEILTQKQILDTRVSVSSIWWSHPGWFSLIDGDRRFALATMHGTIHCYDTGTGDEVTLDEKGQTEVRAILAAELMKQLRGESTDARASAARLCGPMKITEAAPVLISCLNDRTVTGQEGVSSGSMQDVQGIRAAAGAALAAVAAPEVAVPLIEKCLAETTPPSRRELLDGVAAIDGGDEPVPHQASAYLLATWHHLSESELEDVRQYAVRAMLRREQGQYVLDHPALVSDQDEWTRIEAVRCLGSREDARAIPLLRTALESSDATVRIWALRGLIHQRAEGLDDVLRKAMQGTDRYVAKDATMELVRKGDADATERMIRNIEILMSYTRDRGGWGIAEIDAGEWCEVIAERKIKAAEPALRHALANPNESIRRPACGALAALGDHEALVQLREYAIRGDALDRRRSIRMLALAGDVASIPALKVAVNDREPWVREAAADAIGRLSPDPTSRPSGGARTK